MREEFGADSGIHQRHLAKFGSSLGNLARLATHEHFFQLLSGNPLNLNELGCPAYDHHTDCRKRQTAHYGVAPIGQCNTHHYAAFVVLVHFALSFSTVPTQRDNPPELSNSVSIQSHLIRPSHCSNIYNRSSSSRRVCFNSCRC